MIVFAIYGPQIITVVVVDQRRGFNVFPSPSKVSTRAVLWFPVVSLAYDRAASITSARVAGRTHCANTVAPFAPPERSPHPHRLALE